MCDIFVFASYPAHPCSHPTPATPPTALELEKCATCAHFSSSAASYPASFSLHSYSPSIHSTAPLLEKRARGTWAHFSSLATSHPAPLANMKMHPSAFHPTPAATPPHPLHSNTKNVPCRPFHPAPLAEQLSGHLSPTSQTPRTAVFCGCPAIEKPK